jgi:protein kinase A
MPILPPQVQTVKQGEPEPATPPRAAPKLVYGGSKTESSLSKHLPSDAVTSKVAMHRIAAQKLPVVPDKLSSQEARRQRRHEQHAGRVSPDRDLDNAATAAAAAEDRTLWERRPSRERRRLPDGTKWTDFEIVETIGRGEYGFVVVARHIVSKQIYAVKILSKRQALKAGTVNKLLREIQVARLVSGHPYVIDMAGAFQDTNYVYCAMQFCDGADLFALIAREGRIRDSRDLRTYVSQLLLGLDHMHERGVVYRDLKPENILIDARGLLKIADFGLSKQIGKDGRTETHCGTLEYLAPEIITKSGHGIAADFWALGVLIYEMTVGRGPFDTKTRRRSVKEVHSQILTVEKHPIACDHRTFARDPGLVPLVQGLLKYDPAARIGMGERGIDEIKAIPWLCGGTGAAPVDWNAVARGDCPAVSFVPPRPQRDGKAAASGPFDDIVDTQFFDAKEEAEQEYQEQEAFECWLPKLLPDDAKLFEGLC